MPNTIMNIPTQPVRTGALPKSPKPPLDGAIQPPQATFQQALRDTRKSSQEVERRADETRKNEPAAKSARHGKLRKTESKKDGNNKPRTQEHPTDVETLSPSPAADSAEAEVSNTAAAPAALVALSAEAGEPADRLANSDATAQAVPIDPLSLSQIQQTQTISATVPAPAPAPQQSVGPAAPAVKGQIEPRSEGDRTIVDALPAGSDGARTEQSFSPAHDIAGKFAPEEQISSDAVAPGRDHAIVEEVQIAPVDQTSPVDQTTPIDRAAEALAPPRKGNVPPVRPQLHSLLADAQPTQPEQRVKSAAPAATAPAADMISSFQSVLEELVVLREPPPPQPQPPTAGMDPHPELPVAAQHATVDKTDLPQAPAAQQSPPEARFAELNHPRIITAIRSALLPNGGSMQLRLDPPELGSLAVRIELRDGAITAAFQTSNDDATRLLSHSLGQLKHALESQGVSVERLQVERAPQNDQSRQSSDDQQQQQQGHSPHQQEQQRRELLQRMWRKLSGAADPLDVTA